jgi:hypothetical protein
LDSLAVVLGIQRGRAARENLKVVVPAAVQLQRVMVVADLRPDTVEVGHQVRADRLRVMVVAEPPVAVGLPPVMEGVVLQVVVDLRAAVGLQVDLVSAVVPEAGWDSVAAWGLEVAWGLAVEWELVQGCLRKTFPESCLLPNTNLFDFMISMPRQTAFTDIACVC